MTHCSVETSIPDWIIDHPETLAVFQKLGIDYSCGGKSLEYACQERGLVTESVLSILREVIDDAGRDSRSSSSTPIED